MVNGYLCKLNVIALQSLEPNQQAGWIEAMRARLNFGEVASLLWEMQRLAPASLEAEEAIRKLIGYLQTRTQRLNYRAFKRGQYPRGSGGSESANKFSGHVRMKRSGPWWYISVGIQGPSALCVLQ
jgi:hypothetical protein